MENPIENRFLTNEERRYFGLEEIADMCRKMVG